MARKPQVVNKQQALLEIKRLQNQCDTYGKEQVRLTQVASDARNEANKANEKLADMKRELAKKDVIMQQLVCTLASSLGVEGALNSTPAPLSDLMRRYYGS